jgi:hypothetical protein
LSSIPNPAFGVPDSRMSAGDRHFAGDRHL